MDRLRESLRKNPDVIAIAVLCLVLGLGRQVPPQWSETALQTVRPDTIERIWAEVEDAADSFCLEAYLPNWLAR
jgi:hypothetical protein